MEVIVTIAYFFLLRLIFFDYKLLRFNFFWKFVVCAIYVGAALTEVIFLGQYTPYSKETVVNRYVVQIAAERGGEILDVPVTPNAPVKKGAVLIELDTWKEKNKVDELEAALVQAQQAVKALAASVAAAKAQVQVEEDAVAEAKASYDSATAAVEQAKSQEVFAKEQYEIEDKDLKAGAGSKLRTASAKRTWESAQAAHASAIAAQKQAAVKAGSDAAVAEAKAELRAAEARYESEVGGVHTEVAQVQAQLDSARTELEERTVRAPSDGYVTNLQVKPGQVVRLKAPFMTFVSTDAYRLVSKHIQKGMQWVQPGDVGEVALDMFPGKVFPAEVVSVAWITPNAQGQISGTVQDVRLAREANFTVVMRLTGEHADHPLRFGAQGIAAVYTSKAVDFLKVLRKIEIRSESYLNYLFNPF